MYRLCGIVQTLAIVVEWNIGTSGLMICLPIMMLVVHSTSINYLERVLLVLQQVSTSYFVRIIIQIACGLLVVCKVRVGVVHVTIGVSCEIVEGAV